MRIVAPVAYRFTYCFGMGTILKYFNSSPVIFIIAEPDLLSSCFSQSDLQSRSPEAIFKISDPESINRKKLTT